MKNKPVRAAVLVGALLFLALLAAAITGPTMNSMALIKAQSKVAVKPETADQTKYGRYIITERKPDNRPPAQQAEDAPPAPDMLTQMMLLDSEVVKGAYYTEVSWLWKGYPDKVWVKEHAHNFDEVFGFFGTDPKDPKNLCGEIELHIGGERHLLTKSCLVFVPKGLKHCPLTIRRVDRPILFFTTGPSDIYKNIK